MRRVTWPLLILIAGIAGAAAPPGAADRAPALEIVSPQANAVVVGVTRLEAVLTPPIRATRVSFTVDGQIVCTPTDPPYRCSWDAGTAARSHHIRVTAYLADGQRLVANVRTKDIGYVERVDVDAVQVPVIVTSGGRFVRGLTAPDFAIAEDEVPQRIASLVSEDVPLDLVLAIDISGSMEGSLGEVKQAVKQLLSKLRPGDAATLLGFNETTFVVAERETDQRAREGAVDLLAAWGGTALYDATIRALDLLTRQRGRKGVIIFSDGDDRDSLARPETAMARVQASDAMLFTVAFGQGGSVPKLRKGLESYAHASGGRAFFARTPKELDAVFAEIVDELANQYVLSYSSSNLLRDGAWHRIKVSVRNGKYNVRARQGYRSKGAPRIGGE